MRRFVYRSWLCAMILISALTVAFYFSFTADDSYIVARYAENLIDFGQLTFNRGEAVCALTAPLHAFVEALLYRLTGSTITSYKILSILLFILTVIFLFGRFRAADGRLKLAVAAVLLLSPCILLWTCGGLETPLLMLLITTLVAASDRGKGFGLSGLVLICLLAGLAFLTRYDSILFTGPIVVHAFHKNGRPGESAAAAIIGAILPFLWLWWAWHYYGDPLPTSFYVKMPIPTIRLIIANGLYIVQYLLLAGPALLLVYWLLAVGDGKRSLPAWVSELRRMWGACAGLTLVLVYGLLTARTHMMFSFRYFVPYIPAFLILLGVSITRMSERNPAASRRAGRYFFPFLASLVVLLAFQAYYTYRYSLNGLSLIGEYRRIGARDYQRYFISTLAAGAGDIRTHWQRTSTSEIRVPRIWTFAEGALPYAYREAFILGVSVTPPEVKQSDMRLYADYLHVLLPRHGSLKKQLPMAVSNYELVSSRQAPFDGETESFMTFFNPRPEAYRFPKAE